ncbi:hypothetical protein GBA52_010007 [Prunus armeniaca]|nr:hypothetical protein GBA52_010007 [Prunus armeniaca]
MVHFKIHLKSKVWGSKGPEPPNWMVLRCSSSISRNLRPKAFLKSRAKMRPLDETETTAVFEKLFKFTGNNLKNIVENPSHEGPDPDSGCNLSYSINPTVQFYPITTICLHLSFSIKIPQERQALRDPIQWWVSMPTMDWKPVSFSGRLESQKKPPTLVKEKKYPNYIPKYYCEKDPFSYRTSHPKPPKTPRGTKNFHPPHKGPSNPESSSPP